jgi:hypothetical protein
MTTATVFFLIGSFQYIMLPVSQKKKNSVQVFTDMNILTQTSKVLIVYKLLNITRNLHVPVIILTLTPRFSALRMVSALSCLGGSNKGNNPQNVQGPPGLSLVFSGTSCIRKGYVYDE